MEAGADADVVVRMDCFASRKSRSHWSSLLPLPVLELLLPACGVVVMMGGPASLPLLSWLADPRAIVSPQQQL